MTRVGSQKIPHCRSEPQHALAQASVNRMPHWRDADQHPKSGAQPRKENTMAEEYLEPDLDTPTEADLDAAYSSRFLGVVDFGNKKIRTKIAKVRKEEVKDRDSGKLKKRFLVWFDHIDKCLVLNPTNKNILVAALGKNPAAWKGADIGILVDPSVTYAGRPTGGVRLRVLLPPAKPAP